MSKFKKILASIGLMTIAFSALAEEAPLNGITKDSTFQERLWVTPGMVSLHFDRNKGFNEGNYGFGLEYALDKDWSLGAGFFRNSEYTNSNYVMASYQPLDFFGLRLGVAGGIMDGYNGPNNKYEGKPFAVFLPVMSYEKKNFGVNVLFVPSVNVNGDKMYGTLAFQLKFKPLNW